MSDYKQQLGDDTFYTLNHLWMLVSQYPKFEEMEHLFKLKQSKIDQSRYTYTNSGTQFPLDQDDWIPQQQDFFKKTMGFWTACGSSPRLEGAK